MHGFCKTSKGDKENKVLPLTKTVVTAVHRENPVPC